MAQSTYVRGPVEGSNEHGDQLMRNAFILTMICLVGFLAAVAPIVF